MKSEKPLLEALNGGADLAVDADTYIFRAAWAASTPMDGPDGEVRICDADVAKAELEAMIRGLLRAAKKKSPIFCLTGRSVFRYKVAGNYKQKRKTKAKIQGYTDLRKAVETDGIIGFPSFFFDELEADDLVGLLGNGAFGSEPLMMASGDKDFKCVPGIHFDCRSGKRSRRSRDEAETAHRHQTLTGDTSDGYPGCPGVGPVKATEILTESDSWDAVIKAFKRKGYTYEDFLTQARLSRILWSRHDFPLRTREVRLFKPNQKEL